MDEEIAFVGTDERSSGPFASNLEMHEPARRSFEGGGNAATAGHQQHVLCGNQRSLWGYAGEGMCRMGLLDVLGAGRIRGRSTTIKLATYGGA